MESLMKGNSQSGRWYPQPIRTYMYAISIKGAIGNRGLIRKNFAYNMQYIEYIIKQLDDLQLSSVLGKMLYKSFIITGMGIIESLFSNLLKYTGNWKEETWEKRSKISGSNNFKGSNIKVETLIYEKVPSFYIDMNFESMINKIERKNLLPLSHSVFPVLKTLKRLRNRVHLQEGFNDSDTDYNNFDDTSFQLMKKILYTVLTCSEFERDSAVFDFLN